MQMEVSKRNRLFGKLQWLIGNSILERGAVTFRSDWSRRAIVERIQLFLNGFLRLVVVIFAGMVPITDR